jgi:hypothetical protein
VMLAGIGVGERKSAELLMLAGSHWHLLPGWDKLVRTYTD